MAVEDSIVSTVNVAVIGVGNCASSLVQGVAHYTNDRGGLAGLTNAVCAGYAVSDVMFAPAFDVDGSKIGRDLSEAILATPNNALKFGDVPNLGVPVLEGILSDGVGDNSAARIDAHGQATIDDVVGYLKRTGTHIMVNLLPTGSQRASELYAAGAHDITCELTDFAPPCTIAFKSLTGPFPFDGTIRWEPANGGTKVSNTMNVGADSLATRVMFALGGPLLRRVMRRQVKKELDAMRRIIEGRTPPLTT